VTTPQPKRFEYAVDVDSSGVLRADGAAPVDPEEDWSPDHLLLAGLVTCVLESLRYHAQRAGVEVAGSGSARGVVTKRESDGRYAFVELEAALDVALAPQPEGGELDELLMKAERDCFVGASLTVSPRYSWTVGGRLLQRDSKEATGSAGAPATP
jgi:organic hydroperoxide reductase OsmC/OhrA